MEEKGDLAASTLCSGGHRGQRKSTSPGQVPLRGTSGPCHYLLIGPWLHDKFLCAHLFKDFGEDRVRGAHRLSSSRQIFSIKNQQ